MTLDSCRRMCYNFCSKVLNILWEGRIMKRIICLFLAMVFVLGLCSCNKKNVVDLSFQDALDYEHLKTFDGETVSLCGFAVDAETEDGDLVYISVLPVKNEPFCYPNSKKLFCTAPVYIKGGVKDSDKGKLISVVGVLEAAEAAEGYLSEYKIVEAEYSALEDAEKAERLEAFGKSESFVSLLGMYDYVNFLCTWNEHYVEPQTDGYGNTKPGYYLYASDAVNKITREGAQWNYGYRDGYFDDIRNKLKGEEKSEELVKLVDDAEVLAKKALSELENGNYTNEYKYVERFDNYDYVYTLVEGEALKTEFDGLYSDFILFLSKLY